MNLSSSIITQDMEYDQTNRDSQNSKGPYILLSVLASSILRDPDQKEFNSIFVKKEYKIIEDSYVLYQRQTNMIVILHENVNLSKYLNENKYEFIAQIKLEKDKKSIKSFSLLSEIKQDYSYQMFNTQEEKIKDPSQLIYYSVGNDRFNSVNQEIKDLDHIKFGKQIFSARILEKEIKNIKIEQLSKIEKEIYLQQNSIQNACKYCLMESGQNSQDFIISPCACSGSLASTHVQCLKYWIYKKIQTGKPTEKVVTYDFSKLNCQICKCPYPHKIQLENKLVQIIPELCINSDTLILSRVYPQNQKLETHFIHLEKGKQLTIGRYQWNQLYLKDMSVSRYHSRICRSQNSRYYLHDNNAKFGTFIAFKNPIVEVKHATLLNSKLNFHFKLVPDQCPKNNEKSWSEEEITQQINY